ncbi:MAG: beta-galactosidase [Bryobacteraceae bacterium]
MQRLIFLLLFSLAVCPAETRWERSAAHKRELSRDAVGLTHEPIDFLRRRGDHPEGLADDYARMLTPANLKRLAATGDPFGLVFFYKGFGLEYERPNMEKVKLAVAEMHRLGMKVSLYVGGTMFTETLYRELPEARDWERRDQNNHWAPYGAQTFRHYACTNEPAYREYLKRILKIGVEEVHADEVGFDNVMLQSEPASCHCPRCIRAFHEFLRARYPTEAAARRRFGLPNVDWIQAPEWDSTAQAEAVTTLDDPVLQEWVRFRCESLARYLNELADYAKSLNPKVGVSANIKGLYSFNRYWTNAVYHPLFSGHIDSMPFDTNGYEARLDKATGAMVSQIRSYKMARRLGISCEDSLADELRAAVHMAFNYQKPVAGYFGAPNVNGAHNVFTPIMEFFRAYNDRYYTGTDNVADVAVLRTWASMAYSVNATSIPATLMEQVLIQYKVPFDILFEEQLDRLERYGAVALAGQESLSDEQVARLLAYARQGGTLILTDNTGEFNQWRERRRVNPLGPARTEGEGRIVVIPRIIPAGRVARAGGANEDPEPGATLRRGERMSPAQWVLPANHAEIFGAVREGLAKGLSAETAAPLTTAMELLHRDATRETIVHFVNFDRQHPLAPFHAGVRAQYTGPVRSVEYFTPDADDPQTLAFDSSGGMVQFTVPATRIYAMVVIHQ